MNTMRDMRRNSPNTRSWRTRRFEWGVNTLTASAHAAERVANGLHGLVRFYEGARRKKAELNVLRKRIAKPSKVKLLATLAQNRKNGVGDSQGMTPELARQAMDMVLLKMVTRAGQPRNLRTREFAKIWKQVTWLKFDEKVVGSLLEAYRRSHRSETWIYEQQLMMEKALGRQQDADEHRAHSFLGGINALLGRRVDEHGFRLIRQFHGAVDGLGSSELDEEAWRQRKQEFRQRLEEWESDRADEAQARRNEDYRVFRKAFRLKEREDAIRERSNRIDQAFRQHDRLRRERYRAAQRRRREETLRNAQAREELAREAQDTAARIWNRYADLLDSDPRAFELQMRAVLVDMGVQMRPGPMPPQALFDSRDRASDVLGNQPVSSRSDQVRLTAGVMLAQHLGYSEAHGGDRLVPTDIGFVPPKDAFIFDPARPDPFVALGVPLGDWAAARKQARKLFREHHPDRGGDRETFEAVREHVNVIEAGYKAAAARRERARAKTAREDVDNYTDAVTPPSTMRSPRAASNTAREREASERLALPAGSSEGPSQPPSQSRVSSDDAGRAQQPPKAARRRQPRPRVLGIPDSNHRRQAPQPQVPAPQPQAPALQAPQPDTPDADRGSRATGSDERSREAVDARNETPETPKRDETVPRFEAPDFEHLINPSQPGTKNEPPARAPSPPDLSLGLQPPRRKPPAPPSR